jgi:hypothetical protein
MKTFTKVLLILPFLAMFVLQRANGQTITFSPTVTGTNYLPSNNSSGGITFVIENNNPFPAILNSLSYYNSTTVTRDYTLWYSSTSLSGLATWPLTVAGGWNPIASVAGVTMTGGALTTVFPLLVFNIPANTTYRFYLTASNVQYKGVGTGTAPAATGVSPTVFSNSGVNFKCGDELLGGQIIGYGGGNFRPRAFLGSVTLTLLSSPCTGQPTAGVASAAPNNPCPGTNVTLNLTGSTAASGLAYQWQRATSPTGPWLTIPGATTVPYLYMPPPGSVTYYRCIVVCTFSGLNDTTSATSPAIVVQPWTPTSPCYCNSLVTSATGNDIGRFTIGSYANPIAVPAPQTNNPSATGGYTNNMSITPALPSYIQGLNYPLSIYQISSTAALSNCWAKVWIDYNHNANFTDPGEEIFTSTSDVTNLFAPSGNFTVPITALPGLTRMRVKLQTAGSDIITTPCNTIASGEVEDYLINISPAGPFDPTITSMVAPVFSNCTDSNEVLSATVCNYGSSPINLAVNPFYITYTLQTPTGTVLIYDTLNTGVMPAFGAGCQVSTVSPVNMYAGGNYLINALVSCPTLSNNFMSNDTLSTPISIFNYRPVATPYSVCQFSPIPFGQGIGVSGCSAPILDTAILTFAIGTCLDNIGSTGNGTSVALPANCADIHACQFGVTTLPALPPGASFTQPAKLTITNLRTNPLVTASLNSQVRMNLYKGTSPGGAGNLLSPGGTVATILPGGVATNYTYQRLISPAQLSTIFAQPAGSILNIGYWESNQNNISLSDIAIDAGGNPSVATLEVYYQYVPPSYQWFDTPTGGSSLYSLSPFDPFTVTNAVVNNSNVAGTYTFFASCLGLSNCRIPVDLVINPTPSACQDTLLGCEFVVGANSGVFDLNTLNDSVRCGNLTASVDYWRDQNLLIPVDTPGNDTNSTGYLYSRVYYPATGCASSDTVYVQVNSIPQFSLSTYTGFACAPGSVDISSLISIFSLSPVDTLYYNDATYTSLHPNPHAIFTADTVYCVVKTRDAAGCADTAIAYIDILPATNEIANQVVISPGFSFSNCGNVPCGNVSLTEGITQTLYTTTDCRRIATIKDSVDGVNLGTTQICQEVKCPQPFHNGQPYVNRVYDINPTNNGKAVVCLYYLQQDFDDYYFNGGFPNWPVIDPFTNLCITQVDGGSLGSPGTTAISIPNSAINASYDAASTVWTICFPVDSFSSFYCHTCNPGNAPLPVTLTKFIGKRQEQHALLEWETSSEINNSHFILERSVNAKDFLEITNHIPSKAPGGNSGMTLQYDYLDTSPFAGDNYYRLKQVDIDGHIHYSGTIKVNFSKDASIIAYPNPVSGELTVDITVPKSAKASLKLMDATGKVVRSSELQLAAGNNTSKIDMKSLSDGIYLLQISNAQGLTFSEVIRKK